MSKEKGDVSMDFYEACNQLYVENFSDIIDPESFNNFVFEAEEYTGYIIKDELYPKIEDVLGTTIGDRKFKQLVGSYMDRNSTKLHTSGPVYMIPFGDTDKAMYFKLFNTTGKEVTKMVDRVTSHISTTTDFKLLHNNPIFWIFYCCIRFYHIKKDQKGLNTALAIYALSVYPSLFSLFFKYGANESVMQYTMDNLSEKYIMKQAGHVFGGLFTSINHSYDFLKPYMEDSSDKEIIRFIQRIRNDQKSMLKNICDQYMKNYAAGNRVKLTKDSYDDVQIDVDVENNTNIVEVTSTNIVNEIITNGLDLKRVSQCKSLANIGMSDCRFYLSKIVTVKYTKEIQDFVHSVLFIYLYDEHQTREDINSTHFLTWSAELFRKTNSNNPNIKCIKNTLDKWAEESGVHAKFKREASRVSYKKAIFWYFILSIQYYNK
jgi:hypothetical protein